MNNFKIEIEVKNGRYKTTVATDEEGTVLNTNDFENLLVHILDPQTDDERKFANNAALEVLGYRQRGWAPIGEPGEGRIFNTSADLPAFTDDTKIVEAIQLMTEAVNAGIVALDEYRASILPDGIYGLPEPAKKTVRR